MEARCNGENAEGGGRGIEWDGLGFGEVEPDGETSMKHIGVIGCNELDGVCWLDLQNATSMVYYYDMLSMAIGIGQQWFPQKAH